MESFSTKNSKRFRKKTEQDKVYKVKSVSGDDITYNLIDTNNGNITKAITIKLVGNKYHL